MIKKLPILDEHMVKQEVLPQNREESSIFRSAMKMHKNAKALQNMSPEKHGLSPEEHKKKVNSMFGRHNQLMSKYYASVGHDYMSKVHDKRARELIGDDYEDDMQTESDISHKQKMLDYALKASDRAVSDAKDFATGKLDDNKKINRRLHFVQKALDRVNNK